MTDSNVSPQSLKLPPCSLPRGTQPAVGWSVPVCPTINRVSIFSGPHRPQQCPLPHPALSLPAPCPHTMSLSAALIRQRRLQNQWRSHVSSRSLSRHTGSTLVTRAELVGTSKDLGVSQSRSLHPSLPPDPIPSRHSSIRRCGVERLSGASFFNGQVCHQAECACSENVGTHQSHLHTAGAAWDCRLSIQTFSAVPPWDLAL